MNEKFKIKLLISDHYLSFEHGLFKGGIYEAEKNYTSTKRLKGFKVISPKTSTNIFINLHEAEVL